MCQVPFSTLPPWDLQSSDTAPPCPLTGAGTDGISVSLTQWEDFIQPSLSILASPLAAHWNPLSGFHERQVLGFQLPWDSNFSSLVHHLGIRLLKLPRQSNVEPSLRISPP